MQVTPYFCAVEAGRAGPATSSPRTGFGMIETNHFVGIAFDGRSSGYSQGVSLTAFADLFVDLGAQVAYTRPAPEPAEGQEATPEQLIVLKVISAEQSPPEPGC